MAGGLVVEWHNGLVLLVAVIWLLVNDWCWGVITDTAVAGASIDSGASIVGNFNVVVVRIVFSE